MRSGKTNCVLLHGARIYQRKLMNPSFPKPLFLNVGDFVDLQVPAE